MKKDILLPIVLFIGGSIFAQTPASPLTVRQLMRDPKWIGASPSDPYWSSDSKYLLFNWNPQKALSDSTYVVSADHPDPQKAGYLFLQGTADAGTVTYNSERSAYTFSRNGDIFIVDARSGKQRRVTATNEDESDPVFSFGDKKIVFTRERNLYAWDISTGLTTQLTDLRIGMDSAQGNGKTARHDGQQQRGKAEKKDDLNTEEKWLQADQLNIFDVLRSRKDKRDQADSMQKWLPREKQAKTIYIDDKTPDEIHISPDGRFITRSGCRSLRKI